MIKLTRSQCIIYTILFMFFSILGVVASAYIPFIGDTSLPTGDVTLGGFHVTFMALTILIIIVLGIIALVNCNGDYNSYFRKHDTFDININPKKMKRIIITISTLLVLFIGFVVIKPMISSTIELYNTSVKYQNDYKQKVDEKKGFYDKMWKVYLQKNQVAEFNKEMFIEVTKLIMAGRSDGKSITWKWVRENQNIPYEEFTKFYTDLSNFVFSQREAYFAIEKNCMDIANKNNTMLDTFPNNLYNKIVNCPKINFEYSFTSDKTDEVFKTKKENIEDLLNE